MRCTIKKSSIENKHWNRGGYNFDRWLEDVRECTLVEISSREQVQSDVKQSNFVPIDSYSNLIEEEDTLIEDPIPKFDDG